MAEKAAKEMAAENAAAAAPDIPLTTQQLRHTPLARAQQCLTFMKTMSDGLLEECSPCRSLAGDLVLAIVARVPPAANHCAGRFRVDIKWNGSGELLIDEEGATWAGQCSPFSLSGDKRERLLLTVYRPGATSEWGGKSSRPLRRLSHSL